MKFCLLLPCVIFTSSQTEELEPKFVLRVDCHWPSKEAASPTGGGRENKSEAGDSSLPIYSVYAFLSISRLLIIMCPFSEEEAFATSSGVS